MHKSERVDHSTHMISSGRSQPGLVVDVKICTQVGNCFCVWYVARLRCSNRKVVSVSRMEPIEDHRAKTYVESKDEKGGVNKVAQKKLHRVHGYCRNCNRNCIVESICFFSAAMIKKRGREMLCRHTEVKHNVERTVAWKNKFLNLVVMAIFYYFLNFLLGTLQKCPDCKYLYLYIQQLFSS